jgi:hypothetical protein
MALPAEYQLEAIPLPDLQRPERTASLPEWLALRVAACRDEHQKGLEGNYRMVPTLRRDLTLTAAQREAIERHIAALEAALAQTPERSAEIERDVLVLLTKMMLSLPAMKQNELGTEAKGEAFLAALDDVPEWAIKSALRLWYRGQAGTDAHGEPFDCHWQPGPADLRYVAQCHAGRIRMRIASLRRVLVAEPLVEITDEERRAMCARLATISIRGKPLAIDADATEAERDHA